MNTFMVKCTTSFNSMCRYSLKLLTFYYHLDIFGLIYIHNLIYMYFFTIKEILFITTLLVEIMRKAILNIMLKINMNVLIIDLIPLFDCPTLNFDGIYILNVVFVHQFEDMFKELKENFEDILAFNHLRIITSLAKASHQLKTCQMKLVKVTKIFDKLTKQPFEEEMPKILFSQ